MYSRVASRNFLQIVRNSCHCLWFPQASADEYTISPIISDGLVLSNPTDQTRLGAWIDSVLVGQGKMAFVSCRNYPKTLVCWSSSSPLATRVLSPALSVSENLFPCGCILSQPPYERETMAFFWFWPFHVWEGQFVSVSSASRLVASLVVTNPSTQGPPF